MLVPWSTGVVIHRGRILWGVPKSYLPTYRKFHERRQVAPGDDARDSRRCSGVLVQAGLDLRRHTCGRVRRPSRTWTLCGPPVRVSEGPLISETVAR